jgi:hypothetical protein
MDGNNQQLPTGSQPTYDEQMQAQHLYKQQSQTDILRNMSIDELIATVYTLQSNLHKVSRRQENQPYKQLQAQINEIRGMLNTRTESASGQIPTPVPTPLVDHRNEAVQRTEKLRLPNVEVFNKGSYEQYL